MKEQCFHLFRFFALKESPPELITEGGEDKEGQFHKVSRFDDSLIAKFFSREVFSMLLHEGLINLELVQKILGWLHTGFNVHTKVRAKTRKDAESASTSSHPTGTLDGGRRERRVFLKLGWKGFFD